MARRPAAGPATSVPTLREERRLLRAGHLLVAENWYPDWHATIDGKTAIVRRGDKSLISVDLPIGAREVQLAFDSPAYAKGKLVSLVALLMAALMVAAPMVLGRKPAAT